MLGDNFGVLPEYQKEQVLYRADICKNDCAKLGYCKYCGCDFPGKIYVSESCNSGERFPNMLESEDWEKFKKDNNITIIK
jgi:hypothetical protein